MEDMSYMFEDDAEEIVKQEEKVNNAVEVIEPMEVECITCHQMFILSPRDIKFYRSHNYELPKHCSNCGTDKRKEHEFTCIDCGKKFTMTSREIEFFSKNGLHTPKRCKQCRKFKKERNKEAQE